MKPDTAHEGTLMSGHIVILGSGPGGYVAAIRAAQLGARVTVIERDALGGVCLNCGCIPSKALLSVVELGDKAKKAADLGLLLEGSVGYDLTRMVARKNKIVDGLVKGIGTLFKTWSIEVLQGTGQLIDSRSVKVVKRDGSETTVSGDAIVIATGSSWPNLPLFPVDGKQIMTSKDALDADRAPATLLIVGGGVEGCEFAALFSGMGTGVVMVEMMPRILPLEDEEISAMMSRELTKRGVTTHVGTTVEKVERLDGSVKALLKNGMSVETEQVLVSVGRGLNSKGIGLEKVGVTVGARGEIVVDARMETNVPGIYAIGDVVGKAMLAHVASAQGKIAVENILGHRREIDYRVVPAGIFTLPEIGRVGLTEQQAREEARGRGDNPETAVKVGRFRYAGLGKAQGTGDTAGLFKIIADAGSGRLLGAHILGAHATDLIHELALAMEARLTVSQITDMIHAHPTFAEGILEAAEDVNGMAIHLARKQSR
ncbi:MAG TPA: dihydrolipoyl dehydrogenase [Nitrospiraceae bacterium]|jgi:dihydrolipoamide dehydrogenase|nr:dihydrolipoyl dehydrogenase [Nitrospiraceae bacterium]